MGDFSAPPLGDFAAKSLGEMDEGLFYSAATSQLQPLDGPQLQNNSTVLLFYCVFVEYPSSSLVFVSELNNYSSS